MNPFVLCDIISPNIIGNFLLHQGNVLTYGGYRESDTLVTPGGLVFVSGTTRVSFDGKVNDDTFNGFHSLDHGH